MREFLVHSVFFGAAVSLIGYEAGLLLKRKFKMAIFNPLLIAILCVMAILTVGDISYDDYNQGAQYLSYLLTPATVCLAVPLYQQLNLLKKNLKAVAAGILSGVLTSILSVLGLSYLFGLSHDMYVTLLPKSITTAIGMGVSEELGGIVTITVAVIIITGVLGNIIAERSCRNSSSPRFLSSWIDKYSRMLKTVTSLYIYFFLLAINFFTSSEPRK